MRVTDYGPVPVSQLKEESPQIFRALSEQRRVLISRYGSVVAVIEPASVDRHEHVLAEYALPASRRLAELTASVLGQRSPSEFVNRAASGESSYVTRDSKVYGVLRPADPDRVADPEESAALVDAREDALGRYEQEHPAATPEEVAAFVAAWRPDDDAAPAVRPEEVQSVDSVESADPADAAATVDWPDPLAAGTARQNGHSTSAASLLAMAETLESVGDAAAARGAYEEVIATYGDTSDPEVSERVAQAMFKLGGLYLRSHDPARAMQILRTALAPRLEAIAEARPVQG